MAISTQLQLRQQQKLIMTPMLQQALKILQMNALELSDLIRQEIADNPMLEELDKSEALQAEEAPSQAEAGDEPASLDGAEATADSWEEYFDDNGTDYTGSAEPREDDKEGFESFLVSSLSLQEHLLRQLQAEELSPRLRRLCEELVGRINDRGYLEEDLAAVAAQIGAPESELFEALKVIHGLDPAGVGARNLRECLLLQLEALGLKDSLAWRVISSHLEDLQSGRLEPLAKSLGVSLQELQQAKSLIASLEPYPGRPFGGQLNAAVSVDAYVEKDKDGRWRVYLNDRDLPRLGFNGYYRRLIKDPDARNLLESEEARQWLKSRYERALWLIRGIEQRQKTLQRVLEAIVEVQQGFLEQGPAALQPLTLKDIALRTGLHESTISRVTSGKRVQTPQGVIELKRFFSTALKTESGEAASARAVQERIKELLEEESAENPLSDQQLVEALRGFGVHIARRTVAKYREELGIPPAHRRRQQAR